MSKESKNREIRSTKNKKANKDKKHKSKKQKNKIKRKHRKGLDGPELGTLETDWTPDPKFGTFSLTGSGRQVFGLEDENPVFSNEFKYIFSEIIIIIQYYRSYSLKKGNNS